MIIPVNLEDGQRHLDAVLGIPVAARSTKLKNAIATFERARSAVLHLRKEYDDAAARARSHHPNVGAAGAVEVADLSRTDNSNDVTSTYRAALVALQAAVDQWYREA